MEGICKNDKEKCEKRLELFTEYKLVLKSKQVIIFERHGAIKIIFTNTNWLNFKICAGGRGEQRAQKLTICTS